MRLKSKALSVGASLVMAFPLTILAVAPAEAASPPNCVSRSSWTDFPRAFAKARNGCDKKKTFYFMWDRAIDGGCTTYPVGGWQEEGRAYQARFAGLKNC